jgi:hypothetical protein
MADISPLNTEGQDLRIIYSKYFTAFPSLNETLALPSPGLLNYTNTTQNQ